MKKYLFVLTIIPIFLLTTNIMAKFTFFPPKTPIINSHTVLFNSFEGIDLLGFYNSQTDSYYNGVNFGFKHVLFDIQSDSFIIDFSVLGRVSSRFKLFSESFNLIHADYVGGLTMDIQHKNFISETQFYHTSSHLGDDALKYENETYTNAGWEAIKQYFNYQFYNWFQGTIGAEYKIAKRPTDVVYYDFALFLGAKIDILSFKVPLFLETELEMPKLTSSPNFGVKLGIYLHYLINNTFMSQGVKGREKHILFLKYYHGNSKIGYAYNRQEDIFLIGRTFRF